MWKSIKPILVALFGSKKFLLLLAGIVVWLLGKGGLSVTDADVTPVLLLIGAWLGAQGIADFGKESTKLSIATIGDPTLGKPKTAKAKK